MNQQGYQFNVILPATTAETPEEVAATLQQLLMPLGGTAIQRAAEDPVTPGLLAELSYERWGRSEYGDLAAAALTRLQQRSTGSVRIYRKDHLVSAHLPSFGIVGGDGRLGPLSLSGAEIDSATFALLEAVRAPFPYAIVPKGKGEHAPRALIPLQPTRQRLAQYAQSKGLPSHRLRGAVGKALDVLTVAAGLNPESPKTLRRADGSFVTRSELLSRLEQYRLTSYQSGRVDSRIQMSLEEQLLAARPTQVGEVLFEVDDSQDSPSVNTWQRIAVSSLAAIANRFSRSRDITNLLRNLAEGYYPESHRKELPGI